MIDGCYNCKWCMHDDVVQDTKLAKRIGCSKHGTFTTASNHRQLYSLLEHCCTDWSQGKIRYKSDGVQLRLY